MEIPNRFERSFFNLKNKKLLYFVWTTNRGGRERVKAEGAKCAKLT